MTERQAKKHLEKMLASFTPGSVLQLLGDVLREEADRARRRGDKKLRRRCKIAEDALYVVGMGLDAALPQ